MDQFIGGRSEHYKELFKKDKYLKNIRYLHVVEFFDYPLPKKKQYHLELKNFDDQDFLEKVYDTIVQYNRKPCIVIHSDEYSVLPAAKFARDYNIEGMDISSALAYRDKKMMIKPLLDSDIINCIKRYKKNDNIIFPVIVKPSDEAASKGVQIVYSKNELESTSINEKTIIEEYVDGTVYHIDGIVKNGKIEFISYGKYIVNCLDYFSTGYPLAAISVNDYIGNKIWLDFVNDILYRMPKFSGVFHLETIFKKNGKKFFLEIAARPAGFCLDQMVKARTNVDLHLAHIRSILSLPIQDLICIKPKFSYSGAIQICYSNNPKYIGKYYNGENIQKLVTSKIVNCITPKYGDKRYRLDNKNDIFAYFVLAGNNSKIIEKDLSIIIDFFEF